MAKQVQSVIFSKTKGDWTIAKAKKWLADHKFKNSDFDETSQSWRFRQFPPSECTEGSEITLTQNMPAGVAMVACTRKEAAVGHG